MPELPEVETIVRVLDRVLAGRKIDGVRELGKMRLPFNTKSAARSLSGATIVGVRRRAKYLVIDLDSTTALLAHLGMTGNFHLDSAAEPLQKHDRLVISLAGGDELRYSDARRFGFVKPVRAARLGDWPDELSHLGPEPLERSFSWRAMLERARGRKVPVKIFIMDQEVVVGVGNIYASEALHAAGVDPRRLAGVLDMDEWKRVVAEIKAVLRRAIRSGGSTIRNYRTVDGNEGGFQRSLHVYGRGGQACLRCGSEVEQIRQGGRSTFFCPKCQV